MTTDGSPVTEDLPTLYTFKGFLCVGSLREKKIWSVLEALSLSVCLASLMRSEVCALPETLPTFQASKRFLPCVDSHVVFQGCTLAETLPTFQTFKRSALCGSSDGEPGMFFD